MPGLINIHVHLREPGQEHKETVAGTAAAVAGGFTAVACMPNTNPVNDNAGVTAYVRKKAADAQLARVYPIGAVSRGQHGEQLADIGEPTQAGCVALTDDGRPVTAMLMRRALEYAGMFHLPIIEHCEEQTLKAYGVAHEGFRTSSLGLRGIPGEAESIMAQRDIALAALTGGLPHIAHMSARQTLDAVRYGKVRGTRVTCEVTPHHFSLTDERRLVAPVPYDTNAKMNPPLRETADRDAMLQGIADGSVDVIATDHAPHHYDEKQVEFDQAPFGITGLETAVSLAFDRLVHAGVISVSRLVELLSVNPARVIAVPGGALPGGAPADISILAPDLRVTVDVAPMRSKSKNTPFDGWQLRGGVAATIVAGRGRVCK